MKKNTKSSACPLCAGNKKAGKTTYSADLGNGVIVIRDVPAMICDQCGESWIEAVTAKRLERLSQEARSKGTQVEVVALQ